MRPAPMLAMTMSLLGTACSHQDTQLDSIARELEATVNRCVIESRQDLEIPDSRRTAAPSAK